MNSYVVLSVLPTKMANVKMDEVIKVTNVTKSFGDYKAVNDVSYNVKKGRIFGLLGPNGAGKTTTIRMINNIFTPDEGEITINGERAGTRHQDYIGYLPEERGLYKKTKVIDQLQYFGQLKGLTRTDALQSARKWLARFEASDWAGKKIQELSKGMSQKVQFVGTIIHDPDILILDEPFSGFDPINTENLKKIILEMRDAGKTIILSTHVMHQVEQMCDDMCLINKGKVILLGEVRKIKKSFGRDTLLLEFEGDISFLDSLPVEIKDKTSNRLELKITDKELMPNDILRAALGNAQIYKFELSEPSIHDIFIEAVNSTNLAESLNDGVQQ